MDKEKYYVLVDESGDLGFQKGTQWFALSAVLIKASDEKMIREKLNSINKKHNLNKIHLREIREFYKKASIVFSVSNLPFVFTSVLIDTNKCEILKKDGFAAYNYACRYLLERVSWFLRDNNGIADVILSGRGTKRDNELVEYIKYKLLDFTGNKIERWTIDNIFVKTSGQWETLQLADVCATSTFLAYQINQWGFRVPCFARKLSPHLYKYNGKVLNYGVKFLSEDMRPSDDEMNANLICGNSQK